MITNKRFTDPSYDGWILPETGKSPDGTILQRRFDESMTADQLLSEKPWIPPDVMTDKNGNRLTKENWQSHRRYLLDTVMEYGFGYTPKSPEKIESKILYSSDEGERYAGIVKTYAGKAICQRIEIGFEAPY